MADIQYNSLLEGDFGDGFCYRQSLLEGDFNVLFTKNYCEEDTTEDEYINKNNFIVIYNKNNFNSEEFAKYYAEKHDMIYSDNIEYSGDNWEIKGQILGIDCSSLEILDNEDIFNNEILYPVREALEQYNNLGFKIWGIIVGYKVPGGYYIEDEYNIYEIDLMEPPYSIEQDDVDRYGDVVISTASRLSRGCAKNSQGEYYNFDPRVNNKLYNRNNFEKFNSNTASESLIVSRIDGTSLSLAKQIVDNSIKFKNQLVANGKMYLDPYSSKDNDEAEEYKDKILNFNDKLLPRLNLNTYKTTYEDEETDPVIPFVEDDSFVWGWYKNKGNHTFFRQTNAPRVFFYNADDRAAFNVRDEDNDRWVYLSLFNGYIATAGAMSVSGYDSYLDPFVFFDALLRGATIGEAYLFSSPYHDWTLSLFGDPLISVSFPYADNVVSEIDDITVDEIWYQTSKEIARSLAYIYKQQQDSTELLNSIVDMNSDNTNIVLELLNNSNNIRKVHNKNNKNKSLIQSLIQFPVNKYNYNLNSYLNNKGYKISQLIVNNLEDNNIIEDNILNEGMWEFEYEVKDEAFYFVNYFFKLEVYSNEDYGIEDIIYILDSRDLGNWYYWDKKEWKNIPINGVGANKAGTKVKYISKDSEILQRGKIYYFKIKQYYIDKNGKNYFGPKYYNDIIYT